MGLHRLKGDIRTRFALSDKALFALSYCLFCCEVFFIYRNFRIPSSYLESITVPLFGSFIAVIAVLIMYLAVLGAYLLFGRKLNSGWHLVVAAVCAAIAPLVQLIFGHFFHQTWSVIPCIVLTATGCLCFLPEMVRRFALSGVSATIRCNIVACMVMLFVAPLSNIVPLELFIVTMCLTPLVMIACLRMSQAPASETNSDAKSDTPTPDQKLPKVLLLTILVASVMEGIVAALDNGHMGSDTKLVVFSLAFIVSAALMSAVLLHSRGSFNNAIFRVCFPIMAAGIALLALPGSLALAAGSLLFLIGRQLFVVTIMVLVVYLVRYLDADYYLLCLGAVLGAMLGSCLGLALFYFQEQSASAAALPPVFVVFLLLGVFVLTIYLMDASNLKTRWGMTAIDDSEEKVGFTFEQSCLVLAEKWHLTKRESELVVLLAKGRDKQAIAEKLYISEGTVKVHARNIYQKLGIHSKQELIDLVESTEASIRE
ncbi:MAG: LuxR C-terminal-related transcriptional regulator [Raoultibacter sp.]